MHGNRAAALAGLTLGLAALALAGGPGFRNQHLLDDHFERYGRQFGRVTKEQYLHLAQQLRDSHPGKYILESRQPATVSKFDVKHGYFGAYDSDGTIRTFFVPADGVRYFERQSSGLESRE